MLDDEVSGAVIHPKLRVDHLIARGSFGEVFRAHQVAVARDVAVKVLHFGLAPTTEAGRLFRDEIRAIGTIDHRNVVRIFDADEAVDGRLYFVMELLHGPTLQQLADAGPLRPARAMALMAQLLDGLAAVHQAGHIHADVKPANAVVCGTGAYERVVLIDFGLSRARRGDSPSDAVGGTRAYMAPEQLSSWQVDARSDVFSAALVLLKLVTGRHRGPSELVPRLDDVADPALRRALERALALDPADRPTAADFARALRGGDPDEPPEPGPPPPFRELAPLTERDRGRLCGRAGDVLRLARRIETSRAVVLTAPSGTGKTSLLRAGLVPYLDASGTASVYVACEPCATAGLAARLESEGTALADALRARVQRCKRLVVILDQLEVAIASGEAPALLGHLLGSDAALVLGVREDFVARLLAASPLLAEGVPQLRLSPLDREGAQEALVSPLAEHGVVLEPDLLSRLLEDLVQAGRDMGLDAAIYPPHVQLVGAALFDALAPNQRTLTLAHYRALGGFEEVVREHLSRTLGELTAADREVAKEVLLALVSLTQTRAVRSEADLVDAIAARHGDVITRRVIARLEARRLIASTTGIDGVASWSLVHDTLASRIAAWRTVQDLDRLRSAEVLRFLLRQSKPELPALLTARQLATLARFPGLIEELEVEWRRRGDAVWAPRTLVQRSHKVVRYRRTVIASASAALLALTALLTVSWLAERDQRLRANERSLLNLGRIDLSLELFDWQRDPSAGLVVVPVPATEFSALDWQLREPAVDHPDAAGESIAPQRLHRGARGIASSAAIETGIEVRGGDAFLSVTGRGTGEQGCAPSVIPLRRLPGNAEYARPRTIRVRIPTCGASSFDMRVVPEGPFVFGGVGSPPSVFSAAELPRERVVTLGAFDIDRTEITNAAFAVFAELAPITDIQAEVYPGGLAVANGPEYPRGNLDWFEARTYCRFLGKDLPTSEQWEKALRGGLMLDDHRPNPAPRRSVPWVDAPPNADGLAGIVSDANSAACLPLGKPGDPRLPDPVGTHPRDVSPYGVADLAGGVQEWTLDAVDPATAAALGRNQDRITRGGNWFDTATKTLVDYMVLPNPRNPHFRRSYIGARCSRWR